jgi:hypothetical protein
MTTAPVQDVHAMRRAAARLVERLGLAGYDNASILAVDAWIDTPQFRPDESLDDVGAYLGEAIIKRHGGSWSFSPDGARVLIRRNGQHFIDPFGKVHKRAADGESGQLLALVNLVEHVTTVTKLDATAVRLDADAALATTTPEGPTVGIGALLLSVTVVPLAVFIGLLFATDLLYAAIGGVLGIPLGIALLRLMARGPKAPMFPPGTLAFEAQLSIHPLQARLVEKLGAPGNPPSQDALAEVAFYTAQLRELSAIVARRDLSPGRGYVGFDTYGSAASSWRR